MPIAIIKVPPTALSNSMSVSFMSFFNWRASMVIPPWKRSIGKMEKITPTPSLAVKIIALIPSNPAFTNSKFLLP